MPPISRTRSFRKVVDRLSRSHLKEKLMTGDDPRITIDHFPPAPDDVVAQEDFSHLRYARGYVLHPQEVTPNLPPFWRRREHCGKFFSWDPRVSLAEVSSPSASVLICGHALDVQAATTDLGLIAQNLHSALAGSRSAYLDVLEELFGQYVVLDTIDGTTRLQSDAIGGRSIFHDGAATVMASHVDLVGKTLKRPASKFTKWLSHPTSQDYPGRSTPFDDVWLLTPNTELTVDEGVISRIGPRPYEPMTVAEAADLMVPVLRSQVSTLQSSGRKIVISASAGVDSRTSLAAFSGAKDTSNVSVFTYTKAPGSGRQSGELHRDKLAEAMATDLGLDHQMFDLNTAERPPKSFLAAIRSLSPRRSNTLISWLYHTHLPHDSLHIRGQINGVGKWHFAQRLHFAESVEISARRMASLTKRGKDVDIPLDDPWWELGEEGFQEYIDTTQLRSVPAGYRMTDMFLWEHRVANWNHAHIVESDVTFDTYQLFGSRRMIRLMLSVPETDRAQLALFRVLINRLDPSLLSYPLNGKPWPEPTDDLPLSTFQAGVSRTDKKLVDARARAKEYERRLNSAKKKLRRYERRMRQLNSTIAQLQEEKVGLALQNEKAEELATSPLTPETATLRTRFKQAGQLLLGRKDE